MAFGDKNNYSNAKKNYSANTYGQKFYNLDSKVDPSMLTVNFFSSLIELKMNPALPTNRRKQGETNYDLETEFKMFLPRYMIRSLIAGFDKYISPLLNKEKGADTNRNEVSVMTTRGLVTIGTGIKYGCNPYVKLTILDENNKDIIESTILHEFTDNTIFTVIENADGTSITKVDEEVFENRIFEFVDILREADKALTFAEAHTSNQAKAYDSTVMRDNMQKIMETMKISDGTSTSKKPRRSIGAQSEPMEVDTAEIVKELED